MVLLRNLIKRLRNFKTVLVKLVCFDAKHLIAVSEANTLACYLLLVTNQFIEIFTLKYMFPA